MIPSPLQAKWKPSESRTLKPHKGGGGDGMRWGRDTQSPSSCPSCHLCGHFQQLSSQTCLLAALLRLLVPQVQ